MITCHANTFAACTYTERFLFCFSVSRCRSETERRFHVPQGKDPDEPGPKRSAPRVRASGRLPEVLRVSQRRDAQGTGMFDRRGVQRGVAKVRPARERGGMVSVTRYLTTIFLTKSHRRTDGG